MAYMKALFICLLSFSFLFSVSAVKAAPPEAELNQYLASIGWTKQDLQDYLDYYELSLDDFNTVADLKDIMGTPINDTNLQALLKKYNLTQQELNALLDHFGDSLSNYKFIEDLDASLDFYVNHDDYMAEVEDELSQLGITEAETEKFFTYLAQVEENNKNQLDQMTALDNRIEQFYNVSDPSQLSDDDLNELVDILNQAIALYEINVKFKADNKNVTLKELLQMAEPPKSLSVSVYSKSGELLIDFTIPAAFFENGGFLDQGENMIHVGELSNELTDHLHNEKYKNAEKGLK